MMDQGWIGEINSIIYNTQNDELEYIKSTLDELNIAYEINDNKDNYYCNSLVLKNDPNMDFPNIYGVVIGLPSWIFEWDHESIKLFIDLLFADDKYICNDRLGYDVMKLMDLISIEYEYRHIADYTIIITKN